MNRKRIPTNIETELLLNCRRRCCICFGLERDQRIKQGQIAHLDHNNRNNDYSNLAFLCLNHHDHYDTKTSQSKGITINEVRKYKEELETFILVNWKEKVKEEQTQKQDYVTVKYERGNDFESANLEIKYLGNNKIHVNGMSLWGKTHEFGPNIGELDFVADLVNNKAKFEDKYLDKNYKIEIEFKSSKLIVKEENSSGYFGLNACFAGEYTKK